MLLRENHSVSDPQGIFANVLYMRSTCLSSLIATLRANATKRY